MLATVMYVYNGKNYRCRWAIPFASDRRTRVETFPELGMILVAGSYKEMPQPGKFTKRPHHYLTGGKHEQVFRITQD